MTLFQEGIRHNLNDNRFYLYSGIKAKYTVLIILSIDEVHYLTSSRFCVVGFLTTQPPGDCEGVLILRATERPTLDARIIGHPPQGSCRWFPPINGGTYPEDLVKVDTGRPTVET